MLLNPIRERYPNSHITWITYSSAVPLLQNNSSIDQLIAFDAKTAFAIQTLEFDVLFGVDKSLEAGGLCETIKAKTKFGFGLSRTGAIRPLSEEADYQYRVGLDDELKFRINQRPETQQITETMGLAWKRDEYILDLTPEEKQIVATHRKRLMPKGAMGVIGYNTGCSTLFPYKKFTVERAVEVIKSWRAKFPNYSVALLGGREDSERQTQMKAAFPDDEFVINTPTSEGLRAGILWMGAADLVLSGCSLGMHIAIALKKPVIAWFGVSCLQEVDVYDRGVRIQSDVTCSPCWRKSCDKTVKCYDQVAPDLIATETSKILKGLNL